MEGVPKIPVGKEFCLNNSHERITENSLSDTDILFLAYPSDETLSVEERMAINTFIEKGGSLMVVTTGDRVDWVYSLHLPLESLQVCAQHADLMSLQYDLFYDDLSSIGAEPAPQIHSVTARELAQPGSVMEKWHCGNGRLLVIADPSLPGNIAEAFVRQPLLKEGLYWLSLDVAKARFNNNLAPDGIVEEETWVKVKELVGMLQEFQDDMGAVYADKNLEAISIIKELGHRILGLTRLFPHQRDYFIALAGDFSRWAAEGLKEPDFSESLKVIRLERNREDGTYNAVIFPMYTPNNSLNYKMEAFISKSVYPWWLKQINDRYVKNDRFVSASLIDYTKGYASECAVFFPEVVRAKEKKDNNYFGVLFVNREAGRYQRIAKAAISWLKVPCPSEIEFYLNSGDIVQNAFALWDLLHDKSHMEGFLPFDPFMVRQRSPFWMYALEELRADLESYHKAILLEKKGFGYARWVKYSIIFDRVFRFPIALLRRVKDYDGVAGQLLTGYFFRNNIFSFRDNILTIAWDRLDSGMAGLRELILDLYATGLQTNKMRHWQNGHDLISSYLDPHYNSKWDKLNRSKYGFTSEAEWINAIEEDEFPHNHFYIHLKRGVGNK
jgi:hypothetical protein